MLFLITDLAFSAAFKIGFWVLKQTYNGVSYVVNAAVAAYGHGTTDQASENENENENDFQCIDLD